MSAQGCSFTTLPNVSSPSRPMQERAAGRPHQGHDGAGRPPRHSIRGGIHAPAPWQAYITSVRMLSACSGIQAHARAVGKSRDRDLRLSRSAAYL